MLLIGDLIAGFGTVLEPDAVEAVKKELLRSANQLDGGRFQDLQLAESVFGGAPTGKELGGHHGRAHRVIAETIEGVIADLHDFRAGVVKAEQLLNDADGAAQADLGAQQAAVEELNDANSWFAGDYRYDDARNDPRHNGSDR